MPFDNPPANRKREILEDMSRILARPESWGKGAFEQNGRLCVIGAMRVATKYLHERHNVVDALAAAVNLEPSYVLIGHFNDRPETTHSDILAWIERAKERVR